jgi:hypothetical protein
MTSLSRSLEKPELSLDVKKKAAKSMHAWNLPCSRSPDLGLVILEQLHILGSKLLSHKLDTNRVCELEKCQNTPQYCSIMESELR